MQELIIQKVTEDDLVENKKVKELFKKAFSNDDASILAEILHDKGRFFGRWNKGKCINSLYATYHPGNFIDGFIAEEINEGFSNDLHPNEFTLEFRYFDFEPLFQSENFPDDKTNFLDPVRHELKEIRFYFTLRFKEGKIIGIRRPKKVIASFQKQIAEN